MVEKPLVGIIMGSDSDLPKLKDTYKTLEQLGIPYEIDIVSAHRTPEKAMEYGKTAEQRGLEVIIAAAGGAAHLPGVIAALTVLPVIGVPIGTKDMGGIDSLYSIVQMPSGIPVATVGIDRTQNAALLAAKILGVKHPEIRERIRQFKLELKKSVEKKSSELQSKGPDAYQKERGM